MDNLIQSMASALLADKEAKARLLDYLQALVDKARPTPEAREVYWCVSRDTKVYPNSVDRVTGITGYSRALMLLAYHNPYENTGRIVTCEVNADWATVATDRRRSQDDSYAIRWQQWRTEEAFSAQGYVTVIHRAQKRWPVLVQEWLAAPES